MQKNLGVYCLPVLFLFIATPALAHPGHSNGFAVGLAHPLLGLDHLLALIGLGLWSAQQKGAARYAWPVVFILSLSLSSLLAVGAPALPLLESGLAATVISLGLLLALRLRLSLVTSGSTVATFGLLHGYAHASEIPVMSAALPFVGGLLVSSTIVLGLTLGWGLRLPGRMGKTKLHATVTRRAGGLITLCGVVLLLSV